MSSDQTIQPITYTQALQTSFAQAVPLCIPRAISVADIFCTGAILSVLGENYVAAGPLISTFQNIIIGAIRGSLLATGMSVRDPSILFADKNKHAAIVNRDLAMGDAFKKSLLFGLLISPLAIAILCTASTILTAASVSPAICDIIKNYFIIYAFSIPPVLWLVTETLFVQAINQKKLSLLLGSAPLLLGMLLAYPFALGSFGLPKIGIHGLAMGITAGSWLAFLATTAYLAWHEDYKKYQLFKFDAALFENFWEYCKLSFNLGLQRIPEWGNLFAISMMSTVLGKNVLIAEQPSLLLATSLGLFMLGLSQSASILVSGALNDLKKALKLCNPQQIEIAKNNLIKYGNANIPISLIFSGALAIASFIAPQKLISLFVKASDLNAESMVLAEDMLFINGISMLVDSIRMILVSALNGTKNVIFASLVSFAFISVGGLVAGGCLALKDNLGASYFLLARGAGIALSTLLIGAFWYKRADQLITEFTPSSVARADDVAEATGSLPLLAGVETASGAEQVAVVFAAGNGGVVDDTKGPYVTLSG